MLDSDQQSRGLLHQLVTHWGAAAVVAIGAVIGAVIGGGSVGVWERLVTSEREAAALRVSLKDQSAARDLEEKVRETAAALKQALQEVAALKETRKSLEAESAQLRGVIASKDEEIQALHLSKSGGVAEGVRSAAARLTATPPPHSVTAQAGDILLSALPCKRHGSKVSCKVSLTNSAAARIADASITGSSLWGGGQVLLPRRPGQPNRNLRGGC